MEPKFRLSTKAVIKETVKAAYFYLKEKYGIEKIESEKIGKRVGGKSTLRFIDLKYPENAHQTVAAQMAIWLGSNWKAQNIELALRQLQAEPGGEKIQTAFSAKKLKLKKKGKNTNIPMIFQLDPVAVNSMPGVMKS
jgi:hypothetical protein